MLRTSLGNSAVTKKFKVKITASAQIDFTSIWDYISQNNPSNARTFISEIENKIYALAIFPERNPIIPEGEFFHIEEYRHLIYKDYRIVYRVRGDNVFILRIFHGSKLLDIGSL